MENPLVSVIIPHKDNFALLDVCLMSLTRQTMRDYETIVVDNGSIDGSVEFVKSKYPAIKVMEMDKNVGFSEAANKGIQVATGMYVSLLNNDTEADAVWLEELMNAIESSEEVGFCASKLLIWDDRHIADACGDFYTVEGVAGKIGHRIQADLYLEPRNVFGASAGAAIYRRSMLEDIGLFDEDFFITHEDTDLSYRAQLMGYKCLYVPTAIVFHHLSATLGDDSDTHIYYGQRNIEFVFWKNMPTPLLLKYLPLRLLSVGLFFLLYLRRGRARPFIRAKLDALRMFPKMLRKRREIQKARRLSVAETDQILVKGWLVAAIKRRVWSSLAGVGFSMGEVELPEHFTSTPIK